MDNNQSTWTQGQSVTAEQMTNLSNDFYLRFQELTQEYVPIILHLDGNVTIDGAGNVTVPDGAFAFSPTTYSFLPFNTAIFGNAIGSTVATVGNGYIVARYSISPNTPNATNYSFPTTYVFIISEPLVTDVIICQITNGAISSYGKIWIKTDITTLNSEVSTLQNQVSTLNGQVNTLNSEVSALQNATTSFYFTDGGSTNITSNITSFGTGGFKAINMSGTASIVLTNGSGGVALPTIFALTNGRANVLTQNNVIGTATLFDEPAGGRIIGIITAPTNPAFTVQILGASGAPTGTYTVSFSCSYTGF